jgi:hypothetical protein
LEIDVLEDERLDVETDPFTLVQEPAVGDASPSGLSSAGAADARDTATTTYADNDNVTRPADAIYPGAGTSLGSSTPYYPASSNVYRPIILNRPFRTVAELGYAFRDLPWKTLDFFSDKSADAGLLDIFCINDGARATTPYNGNGDLGMTPPTMVAGSVNLNTTQGADLQTIFAGTILNEFDSINVGGSNTDISVVGDMTDKMVEASGGKPVWMTLQIAWSGTALSKDAPDIVPRFPSLPQERFMAYQAIVNGARGLVFFGGQLTQVMRPRDAQVGWNWTFWNQVLRPLLVELTSPSVLPALTAPVAQAAVSASAADVELTARRSGNFLHVIAVRRGGTTSRVTLSGLPNRLSGAPLTAGQVMFEYVQDPLPPPLQPDKQQFRSVQVSRGSFKDWFGPRDVHVYRFNLV